MPWTPPSATGLQLWLKADSIAQSDNTVVSSWADSSGNGNTATGGSWPPYFRTNILNGLPIVRFDGSANSLNSPASAANKPVTFAAVIRKSTVADGAIAGAASGGNEFQTKNGNTIAITKDYVADIGHSATALGTTAFHVLRVTYDSSGNYAFFLDGVADGTGTNNQTFSASTRSIGKNGAAAVEFLAGDLAEYVEYNTLLSTADGAALDSYLQAKWLAASPVAYFATLAATSTTAASIRKAAGKALLATSTSASALQKAVGKGLPATSTTVPSVQKLIAKTLNATSSTIAALAMFKAHAGIAYYATLSATSTTVATMQKAVGKSLAVATTTVPALRKAISKTLTSASTSVPALQKSIAKTLSAASLSVPALATAKNALIVIHLALGRLISRAGTGAIKTRSGIGRLISRSGLGNLRSK